MSRRARSDRRRGRSLCQLVGSEKQCLSVRFSERLGDTNLTIPGPWVMVHASFEESAISSVRRTLDSWEVYKRWTVPSVACGNYFRLLVLCGLYALGMIAAVPPVRGQRAGASTAGANAPGQGDPRVRRPPRRRCGRDTARPQNPADLAPIHDQSRQDERCGQPRPSGVIAQDAHGRFQR